VLFPAGVRDGDETLIMKLIVGLGNPGEKYARNRHNIGFMAVDELARGYSFGPWKKRFQGVTGEGRIGTGRCILLKPGTYMNESGRAVGEAMRFYKLSAGDVIVVHDELDLKPGTVRVKTGGGNAGHNGLKSISAHIGNDYMRVRLGIGHPGDKALVINYVLQDFSKADREWLEPLLEGIARGMPRLVEGGEAAFLSEAARGRGGLPPAAAKLNGAAARADAKIEASAIEIKAAPAGASDGGAPLGPVDIVPVAPISVVAAREGTGSGAVSKAVMLPEPERAASQEAAQAAMDALQPPRLQGAAPAQKKKRGFFGWWFHSRIRGGATF
jgi:peptidyl-tRNA hydrolase, PTH1 family